VRARERGLFERLETAKGMSRRAAEAAARLHAATAAPYQRPGALITRQGSTFGIWWWDAAWVADRLEAAGVDLTAKILPEPMARAAGEGWRVAKASSGYEAQAWRNGFLIADLWRKRPFDAQAWRDFVRVQPDQTGADGAVLSAYEAPFTLRSPYRRTLISDWTPERTGQAAAIAAGVVLVVATAFFFGQGVGLNRSAGQLEQQAALIKAKLPKASPQGAVGDLIALKSTVEGPDALVMLEEAQAIIGPHGFKPLGFSGETRKARLILPLEAKDQVSVIASELEASPYFEDVRPSLDREKGRLIIDMTPSGAKRPARPKPAATAQTGDPLIK
jgi:hypothetical protein